MRASVVFRDPPAPEVLAQRLALEIARVLVNAPELPVALPKFELTLHALEVEPDAIALVFAAASQPIYRLWLRWPEGAPSVEIRTRREATVSERQQRAVDAIVARLSSAIDAKKWNEAFALAEQSRDLPRNVTFEQFRQVTPGLLHEEAILRVGFRCNQDCGMCWQGRNWGRFPPEQVLTWIEDFAAAGLRRLTISGGEPTIDPDLGRYVQRAHALGFERIILHTNAVQLAKPDRALALREAGLDEAFVSLHSGDAGVSDRITRALGTFRRTLTGIHALLDAGIEVQLNAVITRDNLHTLPAFPDFIRREFGTHPKLTLLNISDAADPFESGLIPSLVPHPDDVRAVLPRVIERALALEIPIDGLGMACGPHPCLFDADPRVLPRTQKEEPVDFRSYLPECDGCAARSVCLGVRNVQLKLYGAACVRPLKTLAPAVEPPPNARVHTASVH